MVGKAIRTWLVGLERISCVVRVLHSSVFQQWFSIKRTRTLHLPCVAIGPGYTAQAIEDSFSELVGRLLYYLLGRSIGKINNFVVSGRASR